MDFSFKYSLSSKDLMHSINFISINELYIIANIRCRNTDNNQLNYQMSMSCEHYPSTEDINWPAGPAILITAH